jgi:hypothetical protein
MHANRVGRDEQRPCDLIGRHPVGDAREHLPLPCRQGLQPLRRVRIDEHRAERRIDIDAVLADEAHCPKDLLERGILLYEAPHAGVERVDELLPIAVGRVEDDRCSGRAYREASGDVDAAQLRHADVEQRHVGCVLDDGVQGRAAVLRGGGNDDPVFPEVSRHQLPDRRMIVRDDARDCPLLVGKSAHPFAVTRGR